MHQVFSKNKGSKHFVTS